MKNGWTTARLAEVAGLSGRIGWKGLTAKEYKPEGPYFLSVHSLNYGDYVDFRDAFHISQERYDESPEIMIRRNDILICKDGAGIGKVGIVGDIPGPTTINSSLLLIRAKEAVIPKFLYYILQSPYFQKIVQSRLEGATTPHLYQRDIAGFPIHLPPLGEQRKIIDVLDGAFATLVDAAANLRKQLELIGELKQSLLQEAFSGKLTEIEMPPEDVLRSPQFTAQIIAFAHHRHERQQKQKTFGRVKAQKALQLVEAIGGIDLGRHPIKDAAGPNDFQHMLRATEWALQQRFFEFVPRTGGKGYDFKKLENYDRHWPDAVSATKPVAAKLEGAIDPIVPMLSVDAEVFATVHAAWNNLLRDEVAITDDAIVKAARTDWHASKLDIPEERFRAAIRLLRTKGFVPNGTAKYVGGQGGLF